MGVESYAELPQKQEHLLRKRYCFGALGMVNLLSRSQKVFRARLSQAPDSTVAGSTSLEVRHKELMLKPKLRTTGLSRLILQYEASKNLKFKGDFSVTGSLANWEGNVSAEYQDDKKRVKLALQKPSAARLTLTTGNSTCGLGADLTFDPSQNRFSKYNGALYWIDSDYRLVFLHKSLETTKYALGEFVYSYFHKTSDKTSIAACMSVNWPRKATFLEFGGVYQYADNVELRGKVDSNGLLSAGVSKSCGDSVRVSVATQVNAASAASRGVSDYSLGLRVDLNL